LQKSLQELQQEYDYKNERVLALQKVNTNLETSLNKFVQLHHEEKNERKELTIRVEQYVQKYNLLLGICISLALILTVQFFPYIRAVIRQLLE